MKKLLLLMCLFSISFGVNSQDHSEIKVPEGQEIYCSWDFQDGFPGDFKLFDEDGLDYHYFVLKLGFKRETPWLWAIEKEGSSNACMASTSYYYDKVNASDWMVTPGIYISQKKGYLAWQSRSDMYTSGLLANVKGGYNVYITTKGQNPEDFVGEEPVFSVEEDATTWQDHFVDLSRYTGQTIYVAFVNQTKQKGLVLVDNISFLGEERPIKLEPESDKYIFGDGYVTIKCKFTATKETPVTYMKAYCSYNGDTYDKEIPGINLKKGESYVVEFDEKIPMAVADTLHYQIWADINDFKFIPEDYKIMCLSFKPSRKVVIEEGTGMWCGSCPLGIVAFERIQEKYPDSFIGIAIHSDDPLEDKSYIREVGFSGASFPVGTINRKVMTNRPMVYQYDGENPYYTTLAGGFETYFVSELEDDVPPASISLVAAYTDETQKEVNVKVLSKFAKSYFDAKFRIALVFIENDVKKNSFYQLNSFSGSKATVGGFEQKGSKITDFTFQHVARGTVQSAEGIVESIPAVIAVDVPMIFEKSITVPFPGNGVEIVPNNLELVAMIIDQSTGAVVNADKVALGDPNTIRSLQEVNTLKYVVADGLCTLTLSGHLGEKMKVELIDLNGKVIINMNVVCNGERQIVLPVHALKGIYLLKVTAEDHISLNKILVG